MTRYTNLGRKRSYVQAGFETEEPSVAPVENAQGASADGPEGTTESDPKPPKKKRKRGKSRKGRETTEEGDEGATAKPEGIESNAAQGEASQNAKQRKKAKFKEKQKQREKDAAMRAAASEKRRLKRINERHENSICFACRQKGHAASQCPSTLLPGAGQAGIPNTKAVVGICYRCGSKQHTLARCRKQTNPSNPLPFAHCFVCSGKGHLASTCPQNKEKGVYPNGGACKLCGEVTHLAKDCGLRKEVKSTGVYVGTGQEAGADEDDFHSFRRKNLEVEKEEMRDLQTKRRLKTGVNIRTSVPPPPRKVVMF